MVFYAFKMAMAIAFLFKNAVEAFKFKIIEINEIQIASTAFLQRNAIATAILDTTKNIKNYT